MEKNSFCTVLGESPETMGKLFLSTKFPHQDIRWNNGILHSGPNMKIFDPYICLFGPCVVGNKVIKGESRNGG